MRAITCNFWQNLGTLLAGNLCALTGNVTKVGKQVITVDDQLTKVTPGDMVIEVQDPNDTIWNFIQSSLSISAGLLPPYIQVLVGGTQVFLGLVDPSRLVRHLTAAVHSIELAAQDWSIELANSYLGAPTALPWKPNCLYTAGTYCINGGTTYLCTGGGISAASGGPSGVLSPIPDGPGNLCWAYVAPAWIRPVPTVANTGTPQAYAAYSDAYGNLQLGINASQAFFPDPCGWIYTGAVLTMDMPVFHYIPRDQQGLPKLYDGEHGALLGDTAFDVDNQLWRVQWVGGDDKGGPAWVKQTTWSTPIGVPSNALPSPQFPAGMIIANSVGTMWQVSADGLTWVSVYNTVGSGTFLKVLPSPADQTLMAIPASPEPVNYWGQGPHCKAQLSSLPWPVPPAQSYAFAPLMGNWSANFTLANPLAADLNYWTVMVAIPSNPATPCHALTLNCVNGPVMGDSLEIVDNDVSQTFTVAGVDPVLSQVITLEALSGIALGAHVYWTATSQAEMVMEDPRTILTRAAQPFSVDLSRFTAPTTADPMLGLLPLRPTVGADLFAVGDIETTLTGIKLSTGGTWVNPATGAPLNSYSWVGNPDSGWLGPTATAPAAPMTDWTCQLVNPPASQMPYESGSLASTNYFQKLRNRAYGDVVYRQENNGLIYVVISSVGYLVNGAYVQTTVNGAGQVVYQYTQNGTTYTTASANFTPWSPNGACLAGGFFCYDYTAMRRITFTGNALSVRMWSAGWGGATGYTWPGGSYIQSAVPMIGQAGGILAYAVTPVNGLPTADRLELWGLSGGLWNAGTATVPLALVGGTLVTTPWAVYLVGASAIALVTLVGNVITFSTLSMVDTIDILFPNTLTARTQGEIVIFGRRDAGVGGTNTETWMFRISATPAASLDKSILWSEKVCDGAPSLIGAVRDPSKAGRIVGHLGGSIFQVDSARPYCVERWTPGGMTALEAIEHVCQLFGALAVPDAFGVLHIISRVNADAPITLTVKQTKIDSALNWGNFSSIVRVTSQDGNYYFDAYGAQGGALMEITNQPMVWSLSGCAGMAESMVAWFGAVRPLDIQEWTYPDASTAPPWEALPPFAKIVLAGYSAINYQLLVGDGATTTAPLMGPLGGPVYNPVVSSLVLTGPSWQAGTRTNLCFQSEADPGWTAAGTTPPTINSNNTQVDGLTCTSTTFPILASGGYAVCRVNGTGNNAMMVAGAAYTPSSYLKLSRALTGTESIAIYVTGQAASHPITINAANSAGFLSWTRAIESSTFTPGTSGVGYFVIYANILNAPLTVYSSKRQVDMGPATAYIGPTFAAILSAYATVATSLSAAPRVNSCAYSENYNAWTGTGSTITNNAALGPDGLMTAGKLVYGGGGVANGQRAVTSNAATQGILAAGIMECSSLWLRADAPLTLRIYNNQGAAALTVNVTTAWQRFYISSLTDGVHYVQLSIYNSTPVDNSPFTVFLAKGQIEPGATPSSYIGPVIQTSVSVTDYAVAGSSVNLAKAPGKGATLAWTGTYQTGPWRVMSLGQDYIAGKAEATLVGAP